MLNNQKSGGAGASPARPAAPAHTPLDNLKTVGNSNTAALVLSPASIFCALLFRPGTIATITAQHTHASTQLPHPHGP